MFAGSHTPTPGRVKRWDTRELGALQLPLLWEQSLSWAHPPVPGEMVFLSHPGHFFPGGSTRWPAMYTVAVWSPRRDWAPPGLFCGWFLFDRFFRQISCPVTILTNVTTFTFDSRHPCIRASVLKLGLGWRGISECWHFVSHNANTNTHRKKRLVK